MGARGLFSRPGTASASPFVFTQVRLPLSARREAAPLPQAPQRHHQEGPRSPAPNSRKSEGTVAFSFLSSSTESTVSPSATLKGACVLIPKQVLKRGERQQDPGASSWGRRRRGCAGQGNALPSEIQPLLPLLNCFLEHQIKRETELEKKEK